MIENLNAKNGPDGPNSVALEKGSERKADGQLNATPQATDNPQCCRPEKEVSGDKEPVEQVRRLQRAAATLNALRAQSRCRAEVARPAKGSSDGGNFDRRACSTGRQLGAGARESDAKLRTAHCVLGLAVHSLACQAEP